METMKRTKWTSRGCNELENESSEQGRYEQGRYEQAKHIVLMAGDFHGINDEGKGGRWLRFGCIIMRKTELTFVFASQKQYS